MSLPATLPNACRCPRCGAELLCLPPRAWVVCTRTEHELFAWGDGLLFEDEAERFARMWIAGSRTPCFPWRWTDPRNARPWPRDGTVAPG